MTSPTRRPPAPQTTLTVVDTRFLTPGLVRITLGGPQLADFTDRPETDKYVKILFPPAGSTLTAPYDLAALREQVSFEELPAVRTYTVRRVDRERGVLEIDFVVHGDTGIAGPWAANARPGDELSMMGPGGGFTPDTTADHLVFIGDESAVPAIAAALETLPDGTPATVLLEARSAEHRVELPVSPAHVSWVDEDHGAPGTRLVEAVAALDWPAGRVQVFAHGERGAMKALRPVLVERGVDRADLSLSAYWAAGRTEDAFQAEKRLPVGQIFPS